MSAVLSIIVKDLRQRLRDRSLPLFAVIVPLGLAAIFSLVFSGVGGDGIARYAVADLDQGSVATAFVDGLRPLERQGVIRTTTAASESEAAALAARGEVAAAFVIPPGLSAAVRAGRPAEIKVIAGADAQIGAQVARAIAESFSAESHSAGLAVALTLRGASADPAQAARLAAQVAEVRAPVTVRDVGAARRELSLRTYFAAGMAVFFLFFTVQFGVAGLLQERRDGTLARLLAAPIPRRSILWGKLAGSVAVGLVSMTVLIVATSLLLGARWGDPLGVAALVVAGVLAATGVMSVVATFARTAEQAGNWQAISAIVLGMLGGVFVPLPQTNGVLVWLGRATPHQWFLQGLADLSAGGSVTVVWAPVVAMLGFAAVTTGVAALRMGRMLRP
ncbi:ABC transporter permease [Sphaerisporangium dianthi]|uniref:ABC transporter permease n=1 Tax=Sphaerisporangium dianthi TaxID=1436120 RepID=A0ABV9CIY4_9ACTN